MTSNSHFEYDFFKDTSYQPYVSDLYHYTSPEGLLGILQGNSLRFTHIYFLNDKSEMIYTYNLLLQDVLKDLKSSINESLLKAIEGRAKYVTNENYYNEESGVLFRTDYYVASFSKDSDNLGLWNYYTKTNNKTGYNIKFKHDLIVDLKQHYECVYASCVCYDKQKQIELLKNTVSKYNDLYNAIDPERETERQDVIKNLSYNFIMYSLFFKHPKYSSEQEYRIIIGNCSHVDDSKLEFRIQNGLFIPYLEHKFTYGDDGERIFDGIKVSPISNKNLVRYSLTKIKNKINAPYLEISFSEIPLRY